ncbi:MAG: hypothetical protein WCS87_20120 [Methylococcaceae bacterium]
MKKNHIAALVLLLGIFRQAFAVQIDELPGTTSMATTEDIRGDAQQRNNEHTASTVGYSQDAQSLAIPAPKKYDKASIENAWACAPSTLSNGFKYQNPTTVQSLLSDILILYDCKNKPAEERRLLERAILNEYFSFDLIATRSLSDFPSANLIK